MKRRFLKWVGIILLAVVVLLAAGVGYLTIREYRPNSVEAVEPAGGDREAVTGESMTLLSYNTGYGGLSKNEDFFMDGGSKVHPESEDLVKDNLQGIAKVLKDNPADIYLLQEVDIHSARTFDINEQSFYEEALGLESMFGCNYKCDFVPYPMPPIGHIESGILILTDLGVSSASRISLPESFSWPVKTCNLKRCLLESRIPVKDSDKELVLINLHLEAYDDGEGKIAQSKMLAQILSEEYEQGNYVIAGGDFNQTFEGIDKYPVKNKEDWVPGVIGAEDIPEGFSFAVDDSYPTCRLLNGPYTGSYKTSQVYVIDGYIVSPNVTVEAVEVINVDFEHTDHQPVKLKVTLNPE